MFSSPGSFQDFTSIVVYELKMSDGVFRKNRQKSVAIIQPAGDEGMDKFLEVMS